MPRAWTSRHLRLFPELRRFNPSDPATSQWTSMFRRGWWETGGSCLLWMTLWTLACAAVCLVLVRILPDDDLVRLLIVATVASWPIGVWFAGQFGEFLAHRRAQRSLRSELRRRGIPICIACGYEGGDIAAPKCPECGASAGV